MSQLPTIKELRLTLQPDPKKETVWYAKYFIRKVSIYITWLLVQTPLSANQATVIQALLGLAGAVFLAFGGLSWAIPALLLIQLGYIFDCVDGEIARFRKKPTVNGIFLDSLNHAIVIPFMFLGLAVFSYFLVNKIWVVLVGMLLAVVSANPVKKAILSTVSYMMERRDNPKYKYENLSREVGAENSTKSLNVPTADEVKKHLSFSSLIFAIAKDISEYPTSMNIITIVVLADVILNHFSVQLTYPLSLWLTIFYTVFLVFKEMFFLVKVYKNRKIEKKFLSFIEQ